MKVGITFDYRDDYLRRGFPAEEVAEFDTEETVGSIQGTLIELGYEAERIGGFEDLARMLIAGGRPDMVFNFCEGMYGIGREALVPAVLDAYRIPYTFSDAAVLAVTLHKGLTKNIVRDMGIATPGFAIVESDDDIRDLRLRYPLFAKPVAEGTGKGITGLSKIVDLKGLTAACGSLLKKYRQPVLVEEFLPGREFTVGIIGTGKNAKVVGAMEVCFIDTGTRGIYSYESKANYEGRIEYQKVEQDIFLTMEEAALKVWQGLGCRDAGRMDFRMDESGVLNFLEVNPLAGLNPIHSDLPIICRMHGLPYKDLIGSIMNSALERTGI